MTDRPQETPRIAILLPGLYGGGAERTMLNLTAGIVERGYDVDLVLIQAEGPYLSDVPPSVRLVDLGGGRLLNRHRTLRRLPALVRYLKRERPDAMLSALRRTNLIALWARSFARVRMRLAVCEQSHVSEETSSLRDSFSRVFPFLARRFYPKADAVIGVAQGTVDDLVQNIGVPPELAHVIYNPVITPGVRQKSEAPLAHPWFDAGEPPVILAVGRLTKQKDFPTLIDAFARLRKARPARLLILGEGEDRPLLEASVRNLGLADDVSMPGFVENPYPLMRDASLFVLSSRWEGLPTVLAEVLYCGAPIVATDCPSGPHEMLRGGELGRLVDVGNPAALADAMSAALDEQRPTYPEAAWKPYTLENVAAQYTQLLAPSS